ncbi:fumarylacetoacetate hydrolase family protein [uncultured Tateyamaria sp.]|uniref:fumarylacetoacetate hydrolase family protein n=1 Tax=uncultured Tateyamaria sp. TaxID=455651 RepID=UPI002619C2FE|nr:fumarylacetoacetate hydrolase family protein [uncultured Tateyamaria sp.]
MNINVQTQGEGPLTHAPADPVLWPTTDGTLYPIHRIFCVGRNYAAHAREMGKDPDRDPPFFFTKFPESYVPSEHTIAYPPGTSNYHFEVELCVALAEGGRDIQEKDAAGKIAGYAVGLDMTRRDLQLTAREQGRPWDAGKNFEESAPMAALHPVAETGILTTGRIALSVNGETKQEADLADLIWSVDEIIAHLSRFYELRAGDVIMTGTPAGVGAVVAGDRMIGEITGLNSVETDVV